MNTMCYIRYEGRCIIEISLFSGNMPLFTPAVTTAEHCAEDIHNESDTNKNSHHKIKI